MDEKTRNVWTFAKPDTAPTDFGPASTTQLSPYLKFGCLSACTFYEALKAAEAKAPKGTKVTLPPVSLCGQLLWREFFYTVAWDKSPGYDHMQTNEICLQIPWNYDQTLIRAWSEGKTGYPWIDAAMKQLITEGWMHHLARHSVACFLTRGDLFCGWEAGVEVFDRLLLDADWALNNGNWLWLSSSAFFHQYFRVYSPIAFPKKTDPDGKFVRHFLPQLANFPAKYIYEPWKAPMDVQRRAGCIVGTDYPAPIVDHDTISKTNLAVMKAAYQNGAMGQRIPAVPSFRSRWVPLQHLLNHSQGAEKQALSSTSDAETEGPVAKKRRL
jgi:cryptochrome